LQGKFANENGEVKLVNPGTWGSAQKGKEKISKNIEPRRKKETYPKKSAHTNGQGDRHHYKAKPTKEGGCRSSKKGWERRNNSKSVKNQPQKGSGKESYESC